MIRLTVQKKFDQRAAYFMLNFINNYDNNIPFKDALAEWGAISGWDKESGSSFLEFKSEEKATAFLLKWS